MHVWQNNCHIISEIWFLYHKSNIIYQYVNVEMWVSILLIHLIRFQNIFHMAIDYIVWYAFTTFQYQLVEIQWKYFINVSLLNWMQILHLTEQEWEKNEEACNKRRLFWCYLIYNWIKWDAEALYFVRSYTEECHVMTALQNGV